MLCLAKALSEGPRTPIEPSNKSYFIYLFTSELSSPFPSINPVNRKGVCKALVLVFPIGLGNICCIHYTLGRPP